MNGASSRSLRPALAPAGWLFLAFLALYALTAGGSLTSTDAVFTFDITRAMVEEGSVALDPALNPGDRGVDGRYYSQWGIGHSIYGVPLFVVGRMAETWLGERVPPYSLAKAAFAMGSTLAAAVAVALTFLLAWAMFGDGRAAAVAAIALGIATPLWPYAGFGFNAALAAALMTGTVLFLWQGTRGGNDRLLAAAGVVLGLAWATRHEAVLVLVPAGLWLLVESDGDLRAATRRGAWLAAPLLPFALALGYYNTVRFGNFWTIGHAPEFALEGLWAFLISPGGSLFLYAPIAALGLFGLWRLRTVDRGAAILLAGLLAVFFLFYATMADWAGGRSYGPRYLVPLLPFLCLPLAHLDLEWRRTPTKRVLWALLIASVLVQVPGVAVDYAKVSTAYVRDGGPLGATARMFSPTANSLVLNTVATVRLVPANVGYLVGLADPPAVERGRPLSDQLTGSVDAWWVYAFHVGLIGRGLALVVCGALATVVIAGTRRFFRVLPCSPESATSS